ncbi:hypothetical protein [Pontibacter flavimaris]|uniref:SH3 domain-containing protein n=1 Tax=Pontibacter flavimaris TaxID=1797110 RepID=A0A1Q5PAV3_9BACT|nr:hypothetical protein [Pontibacter flavimaris]OKL39334.1 hypothetical protein A3841_01820 [Pontibacter flavimaris]
MKNLIILIALLLTTVIATAQVAIIQDKDGYTNVREKPNGQSQVIHKLYSNEAFWYDYEEGHDTNEWIPVFIPKNLFSLNSTEVSYIEGFIHKSRLQTLDKLQPYKGTDFKFEYLIEPFALNNRVVDKYNGAVAAIAGRPVWGTDGNFPITQINGVNAIVEGKKVEINPPLYNDIYECTNTFKVYKNGDCYIVYQWNSDGAGAYQVVWVFTKDGLKQRLVGSMI